MKLQLKKFFFPAAAALFLILGYLFFEDPSKLVYIAALLVLAAAAVIFLRNISLPIYLFGIFISTVPLTIYLYPPFTFGINDYYIGGGLILIFIFSIFVILLKSGREKTEGFTIPMPVILLLVIIPLYIFVGLLNGGKTMRMMREIIYLSMYILPFFLFPYFRLKREHLYAAVLISVIFVAFHYLLIYSYLFKILIFARLHSRLAAISLIAFPIAACRVLDDRTGGVKRAMYWFFVFLTLIPAALSLQRSIWISIAVDILAGVAVYVAVNIKNRKNLLILFLFILIVILSAFATFRALTAVLGEDILDMLSNRFTSLRAGNVQVDNAVQVRFQDYSNVMEKIDRSNYLGSGLGSEIVQSDTGETLQIIDNTYLLMLWKTGIPGLLVFLSIYALSLYKLFIIWRRTGKTWEVLIPSLVIVNFLLNGLVNTSPIMYTQVFWVGMLLFLVHQWHRETSDS